MAQKLKRGRPPGADKIRKRISERQLLQNEVAQEIGLTAPKFSHFLSGTRTLRFIECQRLAIVLRVPLMRVLDWAAFEYDQAALRAAGVAS